MKIYEIGTGYTSIPAKIPAATEIIIEQLSTAMLKRGEDVSIIDIKDPNRQKSDLPIIEVKVPFFSDSTDISLGIMHKIKRVLYSVEVAKTIKKLLKIQNEKIVLHFHNQYNMFFFLKMTTKKEREKCICAYTNHSGIWSLGWNEIQDTIKKRYFQEAECMKKADLLFLLNKNTESNVINHLGVDNTKIRQIANGVNTDTYFPLSNDKINKIKKSYGLENKTIILQTGSINENKGQDRALKLLIPLFKEYDNLVYVYAGGVVDKEYHKKVKSFVKNNGIENRVKYLGMIKPGKDLNNIYNMADAMILPSKFEAFSLVTIEACSSGLPVLIDENTDPPIKDGLITYSSQTFAKTLKENILENESKKHELKAIVRNIALNQYTWSKIADDYIKEWEK